MPRLKFSLAGAKKDVSGIRDETAWNDAFDSFKNISFKPFNLLNNIESGIAVSINGVKISETNRLNKILIEMNKYFEQKQNEMFNSYSVGKPDTMHTFYGATDPKYVLSLTNKVCKWNNKDTDSPFYDDSFNDVDTNSRRPLFIYPGFGIASENVGFIVENIQFPIPLTVFSSVVGKHGIYGVKEVEISFNLSLDGYKCLSIRQTKSSTAIEILKSLVQ